MLDTEPDPAEPLRRELRDHCGKAEQLILDLYRLNQRSVGGELSRRTEAWLERNAGFRPEGGADV